VWQQGTDDGCLIIIFKGVFKMKDVLYTNGDRALFADYAGSMFVGLHGEIAGEYEIRGSFSCENNPFDDETAEM